MDITVCVVICTLIITLGAVAGAAFRNREWSLKKHIEFLENHVERHSNCRKNAEEHIERLYRRKRNAEKE